MWPVRQFFLTSLKRSSQALKLIDISFLVHKHLQAVAKAQGRDYFLSSSLKIQENNTRYAGSDIIRVAGVALARVHSLRKSIPYRLEDIDRVSQWKWDFWSEEWTYIWESCTEGSSALSLYVRWTQWVWRNPSFRMGADALNPQLHDSGITHTVKRAFNMML